MKDISIKYSEEDNAWICRFPEYRGCIAHGNTPIQALDSGLAALEVYQEIVQEDILKALREAQDDVCSLNCQSTWKTTEGQKHCEKCKKLTELLGRFQSEVQEHP